MIAIKHVLFPFDFSLYGHQALPFVHPVLHVLGPTTDWPALERERDFQEQVRQEARRHLENVA